jgi:ABC-2 type transport system ATP-binding protein
MDDGRIITVDNLRRRYGGPGRQGFDAVQSVSFSVRAGELFALLGTNGAGKTSIVEALEGLVPAEPGSVRVLGRDPYRDRREVRPRIGIMLQDGGFPADLRVVEAVRMWAGTLTRSRLRPRSVVEALELVELGHRAQVLIKQLSGGERRRLDLAMALLGRPEVLFLDEPTTGLDPASRAHTWQLVRDLLQSGTTVVLTTHYLPEAEELADRLAIVHQGRIVRTGTPAEIAAARPARISFWLAPDAAPPALPDLPGIVDADRPALAAGSSGPDRVVLHSTDLQRTLTALLGWAAERGVALADLSARPASLEEAFLALDPSVSGVAA